MFNCRFSPIKIFLFILPFILSCQPDNHEDIIRIAFSQATSDDDWRKSMNNSMMLQSALDSKIDFKIYDAGNKVDKQIKDIEYLISQKVDIILISPIQSKPITPIVQKSLNAGIPVLVIDRKTEDQTYTAYLGADNFEIGQTAAKIILSSDREKSLKVVELRGRLGSSAADERSSGFNSVMGKASNVSVVQILGDKGDSNKSLAEFKELLKTDQDIDFVYCNTDRMASTAWYIAREMGLENQMKFIGIDGLNTPDGGIQMVKEGMLEASILYPTGGEEAIKLAKNIVLKKDFSKINILESTVIDRFNVDILSNQFGKITEQQSDIEDQLNSIRILEEKYYAQNNLLKLTLSLLAIILSLAVYSIYSIFTINKKNRQLNINNKQILLQKNQLTQVAEELRKSDEARVNFFTGISHELKTPISLIMSSIESISDYSRSRGINLNQEIGLMTNNSNRLLRLVNQLLDFRKLNSQKFELKVSKTNVFTFTKKVLSDFRAETKRRNIDLEILSDNTELEIFIDRNLFDKIFFNLLSNALKFTPDNGQISIQIHDQSDDGCVYIVFRDNGIGIPKDELNRVFQPFYKGSNNNLSGSGIGLNLVKQFVELHKGTIDVRSHQGTEFTIKLKKGDSHFEKDKIIASLDIIEEDLLDVENELANENAPSTYHAQPIQDHQYSILIIEDNKDLRLFLKNKLATEYEVNESDGTDAIELAFELIPDIIICDLNLPQKNGFEICSELKQDLRTSHIPTIILTASGTKDAYEKGLNSGADLFLTKPFSYSILNQFIKSLLYNRERLRYYYTNNIYKIERTESFGNKEHEFIARLNSIINQNLDQEGFSVEQLAEELGVSRVQLYRKVKSIIGIGVRDYINNFKLEGAKQLLESTTLNISEIAYKFGFSSPNYFSTAFRSKYGDSPQSYRKGH